MSGPRTCCTPLGDPLAQDIRTLANRDALIAARLAAEERRSGAGLAARQARQEQPGALDEPVQPVPHIFIAPEHPAAIGEIARRVYRKHYRRPWKAGARDLWLLGKILDADAMHGEVLSYLFFAGEFAEDWSSSAEPTRSAGSTSTRRTSGSSIHYPTGPSRERRRRRPQLPAVSASRCA